ncbi:MAG: helix-turn-helix transcriptional regulator [Microbacterium sp.]
MSSVDRALASIRVVSAVRLGAHRRTAAGDRHAPDPQAPDRQRRQLLVIAGAETVDIEMGGKSYSIRPGQLAVLCPPPDEALDLPSEGSDDGDGAVHIAFESRGHVYTLLERELPRVIVLEPTALLSSVSELLREESSRGPLSSTLLCKLTEVAVCAAVNDWVAAAPMPPGWIGGVAHPAIGATLEAVHSDLEGTWTVSDMAAHAHMSRSAFARVFREVVGSTPSAHLARWRMAHALELLDAAPEMPLKEVAERLGYSDEFALSTAFKRRFGASPRNYAAPAPNRPRN